MPLNAATAWLSVADPDGVDPDPEVTAEAVRVVLAELHLRISLKSEWDELLASLAERGLYWVPAGDGGKGHLREGPEEPPVGAVVLDQDGDAWQNRRTGVWRPGPTAAAPADGSSPTPSTHSDPSHRTPTT